MSGNVRDPNWSTRYEQRKLAGECTSCGKPAAPDRQLCWKHLDRQRRRQQEFQRKRVRALRKMKLCIDGCGRKASVGVRCSTCAPRRRNNSGVDQGPTTKSGLNNSGVDQGRIESAHQLKVTRATQDRQPSNRGRPSQIHIDGQDIEFAIDELLKARAEIVALRSPEMSKLPKYQRDERKRGALGHVDHAVRFLDDILDRHGYVAGMELRDREDGS